MCADIVLSPPRQPAGLFVADDPNIHGWQREVNVDCILRVGGYVYLGRCFMTQQFVRPILRQLNLSHLYHSLHYFQPF